MRIKKEIVNSTLELKVIIDSRVEERVNLISRRFLIYYTTSDQRSIREREDNKFAYKRR